MGRNINPYNKRYLKFYKVIYFSLLDGIVSSFHKIQITVSYMNISLEMQPYNMSHIIFLIKAQLRFIKIPYSLQADRLKVYKVKSEPEKPSESHVSFCQIVYDHLMLWIQILDLNNLG